MKTIMKPQVGVWAPKVFCSQCHMHWKVQQVHVLQTKTPTVSKVETENHVE